MSQPPPPADPTKGDYYVPRGENFDVLMVKSGAAAHSAKEDEFRRINVSAAGTFEARSHVDVVKAEAEGWRALQVLPPGVTSDWERMARERAHDDVYGKLDRTKI